VTNSTVETIGEAVFARITDLKYIAKIGKTCSLIHHNSRLQLQLLD